MLFMKMQGWWLSVLAALPLAAQRVEALHFEELRRSKVSYLSRFVETRVGDSLDIGRLNRDVQRLKNLAAIADAKAFVDTNARGGVELRIELTENWTLYPVVNFGGIRGIRKVELCSITRHEMHLQVESETVDCMMALPLSRPIESAADARAVLVEMARTARQGLAREDEVSDA